MEIIASSTRVVARNGIGRFAKLCEQAAHDTVERAVDRGATLSAGLAPYRTGALSESIQPFMTTATQGGWGSDKKYALPQETGSRPHDLPGNVSFFWEEEDRMWEPGDNTINHPGNPETRFLRDAHEIVMGEIMEIAREEYPG